MKDSEGRGEFVRGPAENLGHGIDYEKNGGFEKNG